MRREDDYGNHMIINVIGNGPGYVEITSSPFFVTFNNVNYGVEPSLHVLNGKQFGYGSSFVIHGALATTEMEMNFKKLAEYLMRTIGSWPSSGLTTLYYLTEYYENIKVQKMDLLPSLARPASLNPRKPLPCAFHNWLGERRFALTNFLDKCHWPQLLLTEPKTNNTKYNNPFELLMQLSDEKMERKIVSYLKEISLSSWQESANLTVIKAVEHLFYLDRNNNYTKNWWLYDYEASQTMAEIHRTIAWCQQELLLN